MNNYLVLDLETTSQKKYGRVANFKYNKVVAIGLKDKNELHTQYVYPGRIKQLDLDGYDVLVGHNIKFDLLYLWEMPELQDFFKRGGRVWDTQYAEYTLSMQQSKYASLRDLAVQYGCQKRTKWIEDLLFQKVEENDYKDISDLPKDKVLEDVGNDVLDTEAIYLKQLERAEKLGMIKLLELEMDSILATTEIEHNGMHINQEILKKNKAILEEDLKKEYLKLNELVKRYWRIIE